MSLVFKELSPSREKIGVKNCNVNITVESHKKIREISKKTGYNMGDVTEKLIRYALNEIKWERDEE